jgi:hypothetical protein
MKEESTFSIKDPPIKMSNRIQSHKSFIFLFMPLLVMSVIISSCQVEPVAETSVIPDIAAEPSRMPAADVEATPEPQATATLEQPGLCQGESLPHQEYSIMEPGTMVDMLWEAKFIPMRIRSSADGRLLAITKNGDTIFELKPDGRLLETFRCPGVEIITFAASSDGALWFTTHDDDGRLYRVDPDGSVEIIAESGYGYIEAGPDGSIYAMSEGLVRIEPDGTQISISDEPTGHKFAVRSNGDVAVKFDDGRVVLYSMSGESVELASGYGVDEWVTFGPDGNLYVTGWRGIDIIDPETGAVSFIEGTNDIMLSEAGIFAPDGKMISYHPNTHIYIVDLEEMTSKIFYLVKTNSWAMAYNPGDSAYIAFSNWTIPETIIYRITDEKSLEEVLKVPYGFEHEMAFDSIGNGYIAVSDRDEDGVILRFDPQKGSYEIYAQTMCFPASMTVQLSNNQVWWEECNNLVTLDDAGERRMIEGPEGGENSYLAITASDEFYVVTFFPRETENLSYVHRLFKWNENDQAWEEIADLTHANPDVCHSRPVVCSNDTIYIVEKLGIESLPADKTGVTGAAVRRLEEDGTLTLLGYDFSFDPTAVDCDITENRIIFTTGIGVFVVTPP